MSRKMGMKLIVAGTIIGSVNVAAFPLSPVHAQEMTLTESTAVLKSLAIEGIELDQTFSPDVKEYTASVAHKIEEINLLVEKLEEEATITINGETIESGVKTNLPLATGMNSFVINVTNGTEESTYTIMIDREKDDNNQLSALSVSNGSLVFDPEKANYSVEVENEVSKIVVKPKVATDTAIVKINGKSVEYSKGYEVELPVGTTSIKMIVTAENGSQREYTIKVKRKELELKNQAPDTNGGEKDSESSTQPTTETPAENNKSNSTSTLENTNAARSTANSDSLATINESTRSTANFISSSASIESETETTANLSSLSVSTGTWNKSFSSEEYTYHITLAEDITTLTLAANAEESSAEVYMEDQAITDSTTVTIGNQVRQTISVIVENDDDRKTYVLVFEKDIAEEEATDGTEEVTATETESLSTTTARATATEDGRSMKDMPDINPKNTASGETEITTFWQKILKFLGL